MNLALFDLDNTLLAGDSDYEWGQFIVDQGLVDRAEYEARNAEFYEQYKAGTMNIFEYLAFALAPLAKRPRAELESLHDQFMRERVDGMWLPAAQALVDRHRDAGDLCAVVTATNAFVTGPIVRKLGIPHMVATTPAQQDGEFTGLPRGTPAFQAGKIERVEHWLESLGLHWGSFERTWFYSDSRNDLPLLERVSDPVAVDPDPVLLAQAQGRGWQVLSLRG
ncbi:HAD-IB family hydrolase [Niveibacterium sp. 24ML]|uniref:histidinol-phosphatase n=1 Tax=Niveibacterium sp. 24ML TaxID=2985512 RepID=UPI00226D72A4|nr:HAD family hydrolase [Niveibacterium sp. 24ML]MCX9155276.1 HAD-IB family hydrolase [Niveibacterium sp. 24ML]